MVFTLRRALIASARQVIRWCTPESPWAIRVLYLSPFDISPAAFSGRWFEPAYVASFVLYGVPKLAQEWAGPMSSAGIGLRITGVFCHQSPKVMMNRTDWPSGGECELGDLLVVHDHFGADGKLSARRAVLAQAKMPYATGYVADNPRQSFLYEHWPIFSITKPNGFGKQLRDLGDHSEGARYAQISPSTPGRRSPWSFVPSKGSMSGRGSEDMARFLVAMLDFDGNASRGRKAEEGGADPWSILVDELLAKMKVRDFANRQLLGPRRGPRVVCAFARNEVADTRLEFVCAGTAPPGGDGEGREPGVPEGAGPGVSTILIETSARDERKRTIVINLPWPF